MKKYAKTEELSSILEIADIFLRLMDENRLTITDTYLEIDDEPALPGRNLKSATSFPML